MPIFDTTHELERARPRGVRSEVPYTYGVTTPFFNSFGPTLAPLVNDSQVLGLPAAWRAVNLIANGVASMAPLRVMQPDGITELLPTPSVAKRPNVTMTSFAFWHQAVAVALMRGNFVGIQADFDPAGYPRQVVPVPPQYVNCYYDRAGYVVYLINGEPYSSEEVVHVPGFTLPGSPWGVGMVENFRRSLGHALEQQHLAADTYARGSVPSGVIEVPLPNPDKEQVEDVQEQWIDNHGSQRKPSVLPEGWKFTPLSWSPEDAQFLQSRAFTVAEIAFMACLDPTDLSASLAASSSSITYANTEQREIARTTDAYGPWMLRFEQAWSDLLPGANETRFSPENLMRTDAKTRAEVHQLNIATGVETDDEARQAEGKPALTPAQREARKPPALPAPADPTAPPADGTSTGDTQQ